MELLAAGLGGLILLTQPILRRISVQEVREALTNGEIIEDYPYAGHPIDPAATRMFTTERDQTRQTNLLTALIAAAVLAAAAYFGGRASLRWLELALAAIVVPVLLKRPVLGLLALVLASLLLPMEFGTGTEVRLNPASLLVPALLALWLLDGVRRRAIRLAASRATQPLLLFLAAGLLSLLIGNATWDPMVPRRDSFLLVQLAQWAIFAFSAGAFWLAASWVRDETWLRRLTAVFLLVGGGFAILRVAPEVHGLAERVTTAAFIRAPFWVLLSGLAWGQLLFNRQLTREWRAFLLSVSAAVVLYAFVQQREGASNWVGLVATLGLLLWLRLPRLRWPVAAIIVILAVLGLLFPSVYSFAGGDVEWNLSGGSRLVLIERVVQVTLRNPITGLGPAAYRPYANMQPLAYLGAFWLDPQINSHNNYVDLFAHVGLLGLGLFVWFACEVARLGQQLRGRYTKGFAAGYVNGMLAVGAGSLVIMALADWILPFVYNIGFEGFQASVLVWLFMGGLMALENFRGQEAGDKGQESHGDASRSGGRSQKAERESV